MSRETADGREVGDLDWLVLVCCGLLLFTLPWRNGVVLGTVPLLGAVTLGKALGLSVGGVWLVRSLRYGRVNVLPVATVLFGAFVAWSVLALSWTPALGRGATYVSSYLLSFGLAVIVFDTTWEHRVGVPYLWLVFAGTAVVAVWIVWSFLNGVQFNGNPRYTGAGLGPNAAAVLVDIGVVLLSYLLYHRLLRRGRLRAYLLGVVSWTLFAGWVVTLTASRQGLVLFVPSLLFTAYVLGTETTVGSSLGTASRLVVGGAGVAAVGAAALVFAPEDSVRRLTELPSAITEDGLNSRLVFWTVGLELWAETPFRGLGTGGFAPVASGIIRQRAPIVAETIPVDNSYLAVLYKLGIVGVVLWGAAVGSVTTRIVRVSDGVQRAFVLTLLGTVGVAAVLKAWHIEALVYVLVAVLAALAFSHHGSRSSGVRNDYLRDQ